jgi:hypothetical protein
MIVIVLSSIVVFFSVDYYLAHRRQDLRSLRSTRVGLLEETDLCGTRQLATGKVTDVFPGWYGLSDGTGDLRVDYQGTAPVVNEILTAEGQLVCHEDRSGKQVTLHEITRISK